MKTISLLQSFILFVVVVGYLLLIGYVRDQATSQTAKLWISLASTTILAMSVVMSLYIQEKKFQKPDYKKYFFSTLFIFLFILVAVILRK
jgi:surface polysaccharide O-acyltransferase-like enzyme